MRAISANRRAVREALAHEGWRFALVGSSEELKRHRESCRTLRLPVGSESDNRSRTIREELLAHLPWEVRGQPRHFTSSKVMCWVAADRGAWLARLRGELDCAASWELAAQEKAATDAAIAGLLRAAEWCKKRDLLTAHSGLDSHFRCARNLARALGDAMSSP